ncbi:chitinase-3-like protein 2 [Scyliorhinus canicula]|uniref:chitinase-3-like protein 2 n=1 Tax=Scyliorhinus canicula TaxID=7830 RepID=UPI0018F5D8C6|nr:chitinase-3-like protein 2 [Scyliorhinus canicula]
MGKGLLLTVSLVFSQYVLLVSPYALLCYYLKTSDKRSAKINFNPESIDPYLCSHLVYSNPEESADISKWKDDAMYKRFNDLKNKNKNLKTLLGYIGLAYGNGSIAITKESREKFSNSVVTFLRKHKFDGLDLDWRFPDYGCKSPEDKQRFTLLVKEMMEAFKAEALKTKKARLLLTAPVTADKRAVEAKYEIAEISQNLDFIAVMTFNFNAGNIVTGHHSPLYHRSFDVKKEHNINYILKYWRDQGAAPKKLLVGFPTFGVTFTLKTYNTAIGAPVSKSGKAGSFSDTSGILAYHEICPFLKGAAIRMIKDQKVPYAFKDDQWLGFDTPDSFITKAQWLKYNHFGGAAVWALDLDDYIGNNCNEGAYPLTNALKTALDISDSGDGRKSFLSLSFTKSNTVEVRDWCHETPNGFYSFPSHSHKFYNCACGESHIMVCPKGMDFNDKCHCCNKCK